MPRARVVRTLCERVHHKAATVATRPIRRLIDHGTATYARTPPAASLLRYVPDIDPALFAPGAAQVRTLAALYCAHRFDVLGSGWVSAAYGAEAFGFEGIRYPVGPASGHTSHRLLYPESHRIWRLLDRPDYRPIDWHRDHRSGFRWPEESHSAYVAPGTAPGADIKVPWELARMHHLVVLAYAYGLARAGHHGFEPPERYATEFRCQLIDFIATNPPRRGVNWACTMDVAIRVANWLVAYDLFRAYGKAFDPEFDRLITRSVYEHARHCRSHLERGPIKGNHYLAGVAGLLFAAAFLPSTPETDRWLAFAVRELATETLSQFHADGTNFEGSTCYHALSLDIAIHSALLCTLLGATKRAAIGRYAAPRQTSSPRDGDRPRIVDPEQPEILGFPFWDRLERALEFLVDVRRPDGLLVQFGDNDSGRFLKLWPSFDRLTPRAAVARYRQLADDSASGIDVYPDEVVLDYDAVSLAGGALLGSADLARSDASPLRGLLARVLEGRTVRRPLSSRAGSAAARDGDAFRTAFDAAYADVARRLGEPIVTEFTAPVGASLTDGLVARAYFGMGVFVFRSPRLYLAVRCGEVGQLGNGGHAHNDQLALELVLDGMDIVRDPGTYVYSASPEHRNRFRSTSMHFTPRRGDREQSTWRPGQRGLFNLVRAAEGTCHHVSTAGFIGSHHAFGAPVVRAIEILADRVRVSDFGADTPGVIPAVLSNGYGRWLR